ncbi:nSTAND1 domain-containing NTPase [Nocardia macrotermitis]|uniref:Novel STAND NTPase 1 domain-containing protein n=1 Tax=Nocardia macrotermitis TaxID=2585198 RepID=A0A7K0D6J2_9NOCA|nr:hypothetical protein [Nocardia macrotermitis]MQY21337.1 hypothetical protein [Nocardia macrotermitis]
MAEDGWDSTILTPGPDPLTALRHAIGHEEDEDSVTAALSRWAGAARRLLVIDQAEEVFTQCRDEAQRDRFLSALEHLAIRDDTDPVAVVLAVRADFYAACLDHPVLEYALKHRSYLLGPMRLDELAEAVTRPAEMLGCELEPGLEELVITELCGIGHAEQRHAYDPGALPLLSHVMTAAWERRSGRRLTIEGYRAAGGVVGSVAATAERAWTGLTEFQQAAAKQMLFGLITVGRDSRDTRRRVSREELTRRVIEAADAALDALVRTRLITMDAETAYLTHEIVLDAWPRLRTWLDEDRVGSLERQRLHIDAVDWAAGTGSLAAVSRRTVGIRRRTRGGRFAGSRRGRIPVCLAGCPASTTAECDGGAGGAGVVVRRRGGAGGAGAVGEQYQCAPTR